MSLDGPFVYIERFGFRGFEYRFCVDMKLHPARILPVLYAIIWRDLGRSYDFSTLKCVHKPKYQN